MSAQLPRLQCAPCAGRKVLVGAPVPFGWEPVWHCAGWLDQPKFKDEDYALLAGREVQAYRKLYLTAAWFNGDSGFLLKLHSRAVERGPILAATTDAVAKKV